ncbi:VC0807 family protein [Nocardia sp. NPDC020380]|uniref:VC0807 family protein n=1 Tax=Nocardia sp. NPDC020380 TaxID=3364309 RepID=UPI00379BA21B
MPAPVRGLAATLIYDIGLPVIAYFIADLCGASNYLALLIGTLVSGLRMVWVGVRQRRLDPFALFLLALFGASLALTFATGDARFVLVKDCAMSGTAGLVFVGSCIIKRPLAFYAAQRFARSAGTAEQEEFEATAKTGAMWARWYRVSLVWGIALLIDASLRIAAIYALPVRLAAPASQVLMVAVFALLFGWTVISARRNQAAARPAVAS